MPTLIPSQNGAEHVCKFIFIDSGMNFVKKQISQNSTFRKQKIIQTKHEEQMTENGSNFIPKLHNYSRAPTIRPIEAF